MPSTMKSVKLVANNKKKSKKMVSKNTNLLKKGDSGLKVEELQKALGQLNHYIGSVDGIFGQKTESMEIRK